MMSHQFLVGQPVHFLLFDGHLHINSHIKGRPASASIQNHPTPVVEPVTFGTRPTPMQKIPDRTRRTIGTFTGDATRMWLEKVFCAGILCIIIGD